MACRMNILRSSLNWFLGVLALVCIGIGVYPRKAVWTEVATGDRITEWRFGFESSPVYQSVQRDPVAHGRKPESTEKTSWFSESSGLLGVGIGLGLFALRRHRRLIKRLRFFGLEIELPPPETGSSITPEKPVRRHPNEALALKNIIIDESTRQSLLAGRPPSLFNSVCASQTLLVSEENKPNNHFFGIGIVLFIESPVTGSPLLLGYHRIVNPREPGSIHRIGCSILFHTSYYFRVAGCPGPLDAWVELADRKPPEAAVDFMRLPRGTLLALLNENKWWIPPLKGTCEPLGVVTNDLRAVKGEERVYTQYVFKTTLRLPKAKTMKNIKETVALFAPPKFHVLPMAAVEPEFFLTSGPTPKSMDYLALRGVLGTGSWLTHEHAHFRRGFTIA